MPIGLKNKLKQAGGYDKVQAFVRRLYSFSPRRHISRTYKEGYLMVALEAKSPRRRLSEYRNCEMV